MLGECQLRTSYCSTSLVITHQPLTIVATFTALPSLPISDLAGWHPRLGGKVNPRLAKSVGQLNFFENNPCNLPRICYIRTMKNEQYYVIDEGDRDAYLWVVVNSNNDAFFSTRNKAVAQAKADELNQKGQS
jgi:hypothetical protein